MNAIALPRLLGVYLTASLAFMGLRSTLCGAEVAGVSRTEIVIGQCAVFTGPAQRLGVGMNRGLTAAFEEANGRGGVNGRRIRLVAEDDGYEPEKSVDCTLRMIKKVNVFALAGYVGTPTTAVVVPIAEELKIPLIGSFTGALFLRQPVLRYVLNIRASYDDETEALVSYLTQASPNKKIAVFYQNDSFGLAGLNGVISALSRRGLSLAGKGSFKRNTVAVKSGLARVMAAAPDAVIVVAPYKPTAAFVLEARAAGLTAQLAAISFTGIDSLIGELGAAASSGIVVSQVVPSPTDTSTALARDYQAALKAAHPDAAPSYVSFEGYIVGRVLIAALELAGRDPTTETLVDAFDGMSKLDLGGMSMSFSKSNHQGADVVFLTTVKDGYVQPIR
jgi:ABC-type branched-subunit amino acid transport system substrate-binding protein